MISVALLMGTDFNKIIEIKEWEAHRVKLFVEQINQNEKTQVFYATQDHALAVRNLINQNEVPSHRCNWVCAHRSNMP
jgi:hypothetical protein